MRHVADIPHPAVKITLLAWNGKFLLKLEQGNLEQTYKVAELDLLTGSDAEVRELLDDEFLAAAIVRFQAMRDDLQAAYLGYQKAVQTGFEEVTTNLRGLDNYRRVADLRVPRGEVVRDDERHDSAAHGQGKGRHERQEVESPGKYLHFALLEGAHREGSRDREWLKQR